MALGSLWPPMHPQSSLHWRHNDHDGVSNHQPHGCLLNRLFRRRSKKTSKLRVTGLCVGNSPGPVNSPHKGPVTRKMFPFDDVIMIVSVFVSSSDKSLQSGSNNMGMGQCLHLNGLVSQYVGLLILTIRIIRPSAVATNNWGHQAPHTVWCGIWKISEVSVSKIFVCKIHNKR